MFTVLPNGLLLQWGTVPGNRAGGDYDPVHVTFPISFSAVPYYAGIIEEKGDATVDNSFFSFIYTGTYDTGYTNALTRTGVTFGGTNEWKKYWIALGNA